MLWYWPFCTHRTWLTSLLDQLPRVYVDCPPYVNPWNRHMRQARPRPMHMGGYIFVSSCMHSRSPPICPIKGHALPSLVSQSLALESSTSQNLTVTDTLDYALCHPSLDNNCHAFVSLFHLGCSRRITPHCIITAMSPGLSTTSRRLLSSTERKNHKYHHRTSDASLVFSSCPNNTPATGLHQVRRTNDLDLV